jgi:hypothetical protein
MSVVIEVVSTHVETRSGTSKQGRAYTINEQEAYLHNGNAYPVKIKINLENGQPAYQPGNYNLHPSSFYSDRYNSIAIRPVLIACPGQTHDDKLAMSSNLPEGVTVSGKK